MPELNLLLFLTLALAGVLTFHLYRQDRLEDDNGYGHGQPAVNPPQVIRYRRSDNTAPVSMRAGNQPVAKGAVRFFDLTPTGPCVGNRAPEIRTDFMTAHATDSELCDDHMSGQSA